MVCVILLLGLLGDSAFATDSPSSVTPLSTDPLQEALPILQAKYPDFKALQYKEGDHLADLIARANGKISLSPPAPASAPPPSSAPVTLPDNIFYWRLASFTPKTTWLDVGGQLQQTTATTVGIILDLRSNLAPDDYHGAGQILGFFAPSDMTLSGFWNETGDGIGVRLTGGQSAFHSPIVVLTNNKTTGAAEALAACLQADGALVIGRATAGKIGVFKEQSLSSGQVLRYFVSPVSSENPTASFKLPHHSLVWNQPVIPDLNVTVNDHVEKGALMLIRDNRIQEVIQESAKRDRMSEASLVQGDDPEWDAYLASLEKNSDDHYMKLPPIHDTVLVTALDSLKAIHLSQRAPSTPTPIAALPQPAGSVQ